MRRVVASFVIASIMASFTPSSVSAIGCSTTHGVHLAGNLLDFQFDPDGATARIEYVNAQLCTGFNPAIHGASFSSYWVALANASDPFNLFQLGVDECQGPGCVQQNSPYYFWAFGWDESPLCGLDRPPVPHKAPKGNATGGMHLFTVIKNTAPAIDQLEGRIDGAVQVDEPWAQFVDCWEAVPHAAWRNEVMNFADQIGGPISNAQNWENVWVHSGQWYVVPVPSGSCSNSNWTHQQCGWSPTTPGKLWMWDSRF